MSPASQIPQSLGGACSMRKCADLRALRLTNTLVFTVQVVTSQHNSGQRVAVKALSFSLNASRFYGSLVTRILMAGRKYFWATTLLGKVWITWLCAMKSSAKWSPRHGRTQMWSTASEPGSWWRLYWAPLSLHQHWRSRCWSKEEKELATLSLRLRKMSNMPKAVFFS